MKRALKQEPTQHNRTSASIHHNNYHATSGFMDNRNSMAQQRKLMQDIDNSPVMMLQRQQLDSLLADSNQRDAEKQEPLEKMFSQDTKQTRLEGETRRVENETGMPEQLKAGIESLSGMDMSDVRVHYNSSKPAQLNALAYAQGKDIHLASGQEHHLPHEVWHVVQQAQGRVKPTVQVKGVGVNNDAALEDEADVMGKKALQAKVSISSGLDNSSELLIPALPPVQRMSESDTKNAMEGQNWTQTDNYYIKQLSGWDGEVGSVSNLDAHITVSRSDLEGNNNFTNYNDIKTCSDLYWHITVDVGEEYGSSGNMRFYFIGNSISWNYVPNSKSWDIWENTLGGNLDGFNTLKDLALAAW